MITLGDRVKDTLNGFKGIAIGRAVYLHGCAQILIKAERLKDGVPADGHWIDEQRIITLKRMPINVSKESSAKSGGPQHSPKGNSAKTGGSMGSLKR
ncbi:MAG TPA: hypothetical protein ENH82_04310 [bacterium]|nr:hypothetical protein [bacterium]